MSKEFLTLQEIDGVAEIIRSKTRYEPELGLILGSGLGDMAEMVEKPDYIPYPELPNWPISTVIGHKGRLVIGTLEGKTVMVLQGRSHYYEGYSMAEVTLPVRVMQRLGIRNLIVTNAAGAINPDFIPGDVMLITDHIGLLGMTGPNPLRGPNIQELGERFPDMSQCYDRRYGLLIEDLAGRHDIDLRKGVYAGLSGPSFETPADLRFLRVIGADAVGMSTVPEVIVARHNRMRVLGLSGISNKANLDGSTETTHEEVIEAGRIIVPKLRKLVLGFLEEMHNI